MNLQPDETLPPYSEEAERGALACVLTAHTPKDAEKFMQRLKRADFYDLRNQNIFSALRVLQIDGRALDPFTLAQWLRDKQQIEAAGGTAYVTELPDATPSPANFDYFLETLKDKSQRRAILQGCSRLSGLARNEAIDPKALAHDAKAVTDALLSSETTEREWIKFYSPSECRNYVPPSDLILVGDCHIVRGSTTVIGGAPGVGKSRAAVALAVAAAIPNQNWFGLPVHRQCKTLIIQNENGRYRLAKEFADIPPEVTDAFIRTSAPPEFGMAFDKPEFRRWQADRITEFKPDVVILDPWNSVARDDKQRDYLETFRAIGDVLPRGDVAPALVIVAHTRKPKGDERKTGRGLLNDVAGSHALVSVPRCVFVMQSASDDPEEQRIVWTCAKNNDGELGQRSAWYRRNGAFLLCEDFDWEDFDHPDTDSRRTITKADLEKLFDCGRRSLERKHAAKELGELTGFAHTACYNALNAETGKFKAWLIEGEGGLLTWRTDAPSTS